MKYVLGNWKMHGAPEEAKALASEITAGLPLLKEGVVAGIAPVALAIPAVAETVRGTPLLVGAQNSHWEEKGAFTGELSPKMLLACGCSFAIIGHSERRQHFKESDELIAQRVKGVLEAGLTAVFCIGETLAEREKKETQQVVTKQLRTVLSTLSPSLLSSEKLLIAYEPVWAIGTGKVATTAEIKEAHQWIKDECENLGLSSPAILYGGSVTPENFAEILTVPHVAGGLVGGASLVAGKFVTLLELANQ